MKRKNHSDCGQLKTKTFKTDKTIAMSRLAATTQLLFATLKLLSNYPQTTLNPPTTTPRRSPLLAISW